MYVRVKRLLDILISFVAVILLIPVWVIVPIAIMLESKGGPLFVQDRLGRYGKVFKMYKFRSMCVGAENMGSGQYSYKGDSRVTKVGAFIRKTSIDELPQLFNILKGDMSIIGPRPTLTYHPWKIEDYSDFQKRRFEVRPGVTGLAQVTGRKNLPWDERIKHDVYYIDHLSFLQDIKLIFKTVTKVFSASDNENVGVTVVEAEGKGEQTIA